MSEFRSLVYAFGALCPLILLYALLVWVSQRRRRAAMTAAIGAATTPAPSASNGAAGGSWLAPPPPVMRRRVRAVLARLTAVDGNGDGDGVDSTGGGKAGQQAAGGKADALDSDVEAGAADAADDLCVICLEGWGGGAAKGGDGPPSSTARTRLPCGHAFHPSCILRWAVKAPRCPMCNDGALAAAAAEGVDSVAWAPPPAGGGGWRARPPPPRSPPRRRAGR